jgi:hypothetical protein
VGKTSIEGERRAPHTRSTTGGSPTDRQSTVDARTYAGLFLATLATLIYEILLTRIFSVTMWYHYAFMAVSLALFGTTVGAILVYVFPGTFPRERTNHSLAVSALLFGISSLVSLGAHLAMPVDGARMEGTLVLTYLVIAVPFVFSGICVSLALTRFPERVSALYAADLSGAACGGLLFIYLLRVTDAPGAVFAVAALGCAGAAFFASSEGRRGLLRIAIASSLALAGLGAAQAILVHQERPVLRLTWAKGQREAHTLYEKWNSFSRIRVSGDPTVPGAPAGWGLSPRYPLERGVRQLMLTIDASAATWLTAFDGDMHQVEHLKYDITNLPHYVRHDARVLVVGSGGGRDILSALAFGQRSVVAVEINRDIIDAVNRRFGQFTGHLDRDPRVTFVNDEARSYIARQRDRFDIIQISLIDTWAATSAGAFVLTENSLYTRDAWTLFLQRLSPGGVLSVSRWYFRDRPSEVYRLATLAAAALERLGVADPRAHIVIARNLQPSGYRNVPDGIGTILVSRDPFSRADLDALDAVARTMQFDLVLTPRAALDPTFAKIASGNSLEAFAASFPINIAPPTDDSPFFFHMLRLRDVFNPAIWLPGERSIHMSAVATLGTLLVLVTVLSTLCVIVPLFVTTRGSPLNGAAHLFVFFASIGLGFMLVEISQMQRLIIFLGHPTYSLSVVLSTLLLSSGLGSYATGTMNRHGASAAGSALMGILLGLLVLFGSLTPRAIAAFQEATTPIRITVAAGVLFPLGLGMGMAFPLGMKIASARHAPLTPWFWGINGAMSVCASVLAVAIALNSGISAAFWSGVACYGAAALAFVMASREAVVPAGHPSPARRAAGREAG